VGDAGGLANYDHAGASLRAMAEHEGDDVDEVRSQVELKVRTGFAAFDTVVEQAEELLDEELEGDPGRHRRSWRTRS
jgi:hypothetical protein